MITKKLKIEFDLCKLHNLPTQRPKQKYLVDVFNGTTASKYTTL